MFGSTWISNTQTHRCNVKWSINTRPHFGLSINIDTNNNYIFDLDITKHVKILLSLIKWHNSCSVYLWYSTVHAWPFGTINVEWTGQLQIFPFQMVPQYFGWRKYFVIRGFTFFLAILCNCKPLMETFNSTLTPGPHYFTNGPNKVMLYCFTILLNHGKTAKFWKTS